MNTFDTCIDESLPPAEQYKEDWYERIGRERAAGLSLSIRMHRACSWLKRAQDVARIDGTSSIDDQLVLLWISFNALYGQWDEQENHPVRDIESVRRFLTRILELDRDDLLGKLLQQDRALAERLFDNVYLDHYFWRGLDSGEGDDETWRDMPAKGRRYLDDGRAERALDRLLLYRVYTMRCQLVHGGATHGGRLNRHSVADCGRLLHRVLDITLRILIERVEDIGDSIGPICYPPVSSAD
ncbi:MAG: HEPN domain-containing protein [Phycisphaerales bacterium]|nr:HEPN domain-containing protein [Phycisphaerales bacterium]